MDDFTQYKINQIILALETLMTDEQKLAYHSGIAKLTQELCLKRGIEREIKDGLSIKETNKNI